MSGEMSADPVKLHICIIRVYMLHLRMIHRPCRKPVDAGYPISFIQVGPGFSPGLSKLADVLMIAC